MAGLEDVLGFTPGRRRSVVLGQATTIAAVALVLGVPLGAVVGLLVLLNLIAAFPAVSARRLRVAEALRSE